jgi:soluble lytic murein transglycosylase-like protein
MSLYRLSLVLLAVAATALPCRGADVVQFTDGRSMLVEHVRVEELVALLGLEGGGEIAVPLDRIAYWETLAPETSEEPEILAEPAWEPWRDAAGIYAEVIERAAVQHDLDPVLLTAVAEVESAFNHRAVSPKGASGLLQLMPATADRFGVRDVFDAEQNVNGGARYLSWLLRRFDGDTELALAGYNAGEGAVDRHSGIPPYRETQAYVTRVLAGTARLTP